MPPKLKKLFISYRSNDAIKVDKIARDLTLLKYDDGTPRYTTWQDKHNLPPAVSYWWDAIVDAIVECDMFVFHLSQASLQSEVCRAELEYAHKRHRPIVSVVLDGEFFLNPQSGKYDVPKETWELVPDWLGESQFLFYIQTEFYGRFQTAVELFERNWPRDIDASRPLNPDSKSVHGSNHALYAAACDYAERVAFADAEKHFDVLVRRNDSDYADLATQWLKVIRAYGELIEMIAHRSPPVVFRRKWAAYQTLFSSDLLEDFFDPKDLTARGTAVNVGAITVDTPIPAVQVRPAPVSPPPPKPTKPRSLDLLPAPFAWIDIPAGEVTLPEGGYVPKGGQTFDVPTFKIAKYPLTNTQFATFMKADGYNQQKWWTVFGWEQRQKDQWTEPRYWQDAKWNGPEHPVVGVSWFEAVAFCQWLSETAGEKVMLATEQQWQRAAQGDKGLTYPWGSEWDGKRCNNSVKPESSNQTTPVRQYEGRGDSPYRVVDMAGNVWEWCLTSYNDGNSEINSNVEYRVLRGGSWINYGADFFRADYRLRNDPHIRDSSGGFRLAFS